jgi:beta-glucosidase
MTTRYQIPAATALLCAALSVHALAQTGAPAALPDPPLVARVVPLLKRPANPADAASQADAILKLMTDEEKFQLVCGIGMGTAALPRLGIPRTQSADATAGIRLASDKENLTGKSTAFPAPVLLASTWDPYMAAAYAQAIGEQCRSAGVNILLGPGVNIYRRPTNGRNFEYLGEDPFLASRLAEAYVRGLQGTGVMGTVKHFLCNNSEFNRKSKNVIVDERALHEIYTPAFQAAINAGVWAVMSSYNQVNGEWPGQSRFWGTDWLRGKLGFQWIFMSDWRSTWDGEKIASSGLDLEMPNGLSLKSVKAKLLGTPDIDRMAHTVLKTFIASGIYEAQAVGTFKDSSYLEKFPAHVEVAQKVNEEGIVLLKNNGILPLGEKIDGPVLVSGNSANAKVLSGLGAARVEGYDAVSYEEEAIARLGKDRVTVAPDPTDEQIKSASVVLLFTGFNQIVTAHQGEGEGRNRPFALKEEALIARCTKLNPNTIVFVTTGGAVAADWTDPAAAVVFGSYGGQTGAPAAFNVLLGKTNPSGKLPFTWQKREEDGVGFGDDKILPNPTPLVSPNFNGVAQFFRDPKTAGADQKTGGVLIYDVPYEEGIFVGYRWFDSKNIAPRFPFGHGLSYTTFSYSDLKVQKQDDGSVDVSFSLENTGKKPGAEVAQVYVGDPQNPVPRPPQELKGFQKTALAPGEKETVTVNLNKDAFRFWDPDSKKWTTRPGTFDLHIGSSSRDIRLKGSVVL